MLNLVQITFAFIGFDVLTGVFAALKHRELNSRVAREGMYHKAAYALLIGFAAMAAWIPNDIGMKDLYIPSIEVICSFILWVEAQSIIENITRLLPDETARKVVALFRFDVEKFEYLEDRDYTEWYE